MPAVSTLYGDDTPATTEAVRILDGHGISFSVRFWHAVARTPALGTPMGMFVGLEGIKSFAESFDLDEDAPVQGFDRR